MRGSILPRLWTPPLRELTPATSFGFEEIEFARDVVGIELDPWEQWLSIHSGELLPDGRPRFRIVLALVARQNGKSTWARIRILYWLFLDLAELPAEQSPFVIATSTDRSYAKKFWTKTGEIIKKNPLLAAELAEIRLTISEECITTTTGVEYGFAANNASAGRSRTVHRALVDEVREHKNLAAWGAITGAMNAVPYGQVVCISNQGDDDAVLLDALREPALTYIETGEGDPRLGLFEWSAPNGADPTDIGALAQANPNLNYPGRVDLDALLGAARRAVAAGGEELASFKTEVLCQRVPRLHVDLAIDPGAWRRCLDAGDLAGVRSRIALCLDLAPDELHATLVAAAVLDDGRVRVEPVKAWDGAGCTDRVRADLPGLLARVRPQVLGWLPAGPAAALAADLAARKDRRGWPPPGVTVTEIRGELAAVCMGLAEQVTAGRIAHSDDPLLNAQIGAAERLRKPNDTWVFSRKGDGHCDAAYATAGAVHLARTLPPPVGKPRLVVARP